MNQRIIGDFDARETRRFMLTDAEIESQKLYVLNERLGILCGTDMPTDDQMELAVADAERWEAEYLLSLT